MLYHKPMGTKHTASSVSCNFYLEFSLMYYIVANMVIYNNPTYSGLDNLITMRTVG